MIQTRDSIMAALSAVALPDGGDLASQNMIRALTIEGGKVSFVIEAETPEQAAAMEPQRRAAEAAVADLDGVEQVTAILTAHGPAPKKPEPPQLKIGGHPTPQQGPEPIGGVKKVIAIASGKGGVGKSTVSSNLAVALARAGKKVGLLDADIYGPSQHRMMGITQGPASPDGKTMLPVTAHGVKTISIGMMVEPDQALVWRGPMLMGALQQLMFKVNWGDLDLLIVDLPPGTGDVQLTLAQKTRVDGAIVVSTPQDISLIDARKGIDMFGKVGVPVIGLIENMSMYVCPDCGRTDHIFGHGGVKAEAEKMGVPLLAELPLALEVREGGDAGAPVSAGEGPMAEAYAALARVLIDSGRV